MISANPVIRKSAASSYILLTCARDFLELRDTIENDLLRAITSISSASVGVRGESTALAPREPSPRGERGGAAAERGGGTELMRGSSQRLVQSLERYVEMVSMRAPYISSQIVRDAQFALAGFVDESLLHHPSGRLTGWQNYLIEESMFGSRTAGESFFVKLNELFYNINNENIPLLVLYLAALRMGFLGRFRGARDRAELDRIRGNALARVMEVLNFDPTQQTSISPTAYENTINTTEILKMPIRGRWRMLFVTCVCIAIIFTTLSWVQLMSPLKVHIDRLVATVSSS